MGWIPRLESSPIFLCSKSFSGQQYYEIGTGYYALVTLIEYNKGTGYEIRFEKRGKSWIDLND